MISLLLSKLKRAATPDKLDARSRKNLAGVHPDLVAVIERAAELSELEFIVTEGLRSTERQRQLVAKGASKTMNSRHLYGFAVDLAAKIDGEVRWDWPLYAKLNEAVQKAAGEMGTRVVWGGSWRSFKDGPHFELDRRDYPDRAEAA